MVKSKRKESSGDWRRGGDSASADKRKATEKEKGDNRCVQFGRKVVNENTGSYNSVVDRSMTEWKKSNHKSRNGGKVFKEDVKDLKGINGNKNEKVSKEEDPRCGAKGGRSTEDRKRNAHRQYDWSRIFGSLLELPTDEVLLKLQEESTNVYMAKEKYAPNQFAQFMSVAARASRSRLHQVNLVDFFRKMFSQTFISKLITMAMNIKNIQDLRETYFTDLASTMEGFLTTVPNLATERLPVLVDCCQMVAQSMNKSHDSPYWVSLNDTLSQIDSEIKARSSRWSINNSMISNVYTGDSHACFRNLPIVPTLQDLTEAHQPFAWKNITKGSFESVEQYLNVHFRLLREDFIRPLRNGILEYRNNSRLRNRDVRIYTNVHIIRSYFDRGELLHYIQLDLPRGFKMENTKRFMNGNLLCFTSDSFNTYTPASIMDSSPAILRKHRLGVKFEDDSSIKTDAKYVVIETKAYFEAYKHTLAALKEIKESMVPFQENIVYANIDVKPPDYLSPGSLYDMSVVSKHSSKFPQLEAVSVREDWPSAEELGLDESQSKALRSALTQEVAIIQGPPGTGKTFLGLKITQVLLSNKLWQNKFESPILCVCYTNHALDQFLEGMLPFTENIIRVGSRSKSEKLAYYQIHEVCRRRRTIFSRLWSETLDDIRELESNIRNCEEGLNICSDLDGVVTYDSLKRCIPENLRVQLEGDLSGWLFDIYLPPDISYAEIKDSESKPKDDSENLEEDASWDDRKELLSKEESERQIDEGVLEYEVPIGNPIVEYGICSASLRSNYMKEEELLRKEPYNENLYWTFYETKRKMGVLHLGLQIKVNIQGPNIPETMDIWQLGFKARWSLYWNWIHELYNQILIEKKQYEIKLQMKNKLLQEIKEGKYLEVMRTADVVGMTLTGAARLRHLLQALSPPIVIVEEAAEILESHVMVSLTPDCQHLIMIGDHQQLRPSTNTYELATKHGLDTSLFERMINNDIAYATLTNQHRMRPCISQLLVPTIYPSLKDDPSVQDYPNVKGVTKNVFFITHEHPEKMTGDDNSSPENKHEGELIMALCCYLMLQGYSPSDITVLTPYIGQFYLLRKLQREYPPCAGVRICVVDGFQGEESNIILLSLVRSNKEGKVGFLRVANRVCVALSRAKHGLYIAGNMNILRSSNEVWKAIEDTLIANQYIGKSLTIRCENHPDQTVEVRKPEDFDIAPYGGCQLPCSAPLPHCSHICPEICHIIDIEHKQTRCRKECERVCERNHECKLKCWEECCCNVIVEKELPCGHKHNLPCHVRESEFKCPTIVERVLELCNHMQQMLCSEDPAEVVCKTPCETTLPCSHPCKSSCHIKEDADHVSYRCQYPCERQPPGCKQEHKCQKLCYQYCDRCNIIVNKTLPCGHEAQLQCHKSENLVKCGSLCTKILPCLHEQVVQCFESENDIKCMELCLKILPCGHVQQSQCHVCLEEIRCTEACEKTLLCGHPCQRKCVEECHCEVKVEKTVNSCGHKVMVECQEEAVNCKSMCEELLSCGHRCRSRCSEPCTKTCKEVVVSQCLQGHTLHVLCHIVLSGNTEAIWLNCKEPCKTVLECGHQCSGSCASCLHGLLHTPCIQKCQRFLVCGHRCKRKCSSVCSPCSEIVSFRCAHETSKMLCGSPRKTCQEPCTWQCVHHKCKKICSDICDLPACDEPCFELLPCGHPCTGFCGDPHPICRLCNEQEDLKPNQSKEARFVLLEDCGHSVEVGILEQWLKQNDKIGVKTCPKCSHPIHNNRRYKKIITSSYEDAVNLRQQYLKSNAITKDKVTEIVINAVQHDVYKAHLMKINQSLDKLPKTFTDHHLIANLNKLFICFFQASVVLKASEIHSMNQSLKSCKPLERLVDNVMEQNLISHQYMREMSSELQRASYLDYYVCHEDERNAHLTDEASDLLNCDLRFDVLIEKKFKELTNSKASTRLTILSQYGLRFGVWMRCPEGHIYCIRECGHPNHAEYHKPCKGCNKKVDKVIPECGHKITLECLAQPTKALCRRQCMLKLECGHACQALCCQKCTSKCSESVQPRLKCPRGHAVTIPCHLSRTAEMDEWWQHCKSNCGETLDCGHLCAGQCGSCYRDGDHQQCKELCTKEFPCGHRCSLKCYEDCGDCRRRCERRCKHKRCSNTCGAPCDPCLNRCSWRCEHHLCKNTCGEECTRPACDHPCPKKLKCGHLCIGFCGDPCPPLCRICNREELQAAASNKVQDTPEKEDQDIEGITAGMLHLATKGSTSPESRDSSKEKRSALQQSQKSSLKPQDLSLCEGERFVLLEDCRHTVAAKDLERLLGMNKENDLESRLEMYRGERKVPKCPRCSHPIYNNRRYQNLVYSYILPSHSSDLEVGSVTGAVPKFRNSLGQGISGRNAFFPPRMPRRARDTNTWRTGTYGLPRTQRTQDETVAPRMPRRARGTNTWRTGTYGLPRTQRTQDETVAGNTYSERGRARGRSSNRRNRGRGKPVMIGR